MAPLSRWACERERLLQSAHRTIPRHPSRNAAATAALFHVDSKTLRITMHLNYSQANQPSRLFKSPDWLNKSNPIWCFPMLISMQIRAAAGRWKWQPGEFQVVEGEKIKIWFSSKWESNGSWWGSWTRPGLNFQHLKCTSDRRLITGAQDEVCAGLRGVVGWGGGWWKDIAELISSYRNLVTGDEKLTSSRVAVWTGWEIV